MEYTHQTFGILIFCVTPFFVASASGNSMSATLANAQSVYCSNTIGIDSGPGGNGMTTISPLAAALVGKTNQSGSTMPAYVPGKFPTAVNIAPITQLNHSQMQEMFQHKGGTYLPEFMAATKEEAEQHLSDVLNMTVPDKKSVSNPNLTMYDNYMAQRTLLDDMKQLLRRGSAKSQPTSKAQNSNALPTPFKATLRTSLPTALSQTTKSRDLETTTPGTTTRPTTISKTGDMLAAFMVNSPYDSASSNPSNTEENTNKDMLPVREGSNFEGQLHVPDWTSVWKEANTTLDPEAMSELEVTNRRSKRDSNVSLSTEQYCHLKGSKTQDGYLHTCSTCAMITQLPDNYFPRFINEAICKTGDTGCFVINGVAHGECRQRTITLNIMRKKANRCLLMTHNGQRTLTDDWELYPHTIRVSCECLIKKNSFLARYVKGSSAHG